MVVVALLSVDLVESVDLVSVELVVNCTFSSLVRSLTRSFLWSLILTNVIIETVTNSIVATSSDSPSYSHLYKLKCSVT